jgi:hypothetical protein
VGYNFGGEGVGAGRFLIFFALHFPDAFVLAFQPFEVLLVEGVVLFEAGVLGLDVKFAADVGTERALVPQLFLAASSAFVLQPALADLHRLPLLVESLEHIGVLPGVVVDLLGCCCRLAEIVNGERAEGVSFA